MGGYSRRHFLSALVGGLVAAIVMAALPAGAGNGDPVLAGKRTRAHGMTRLVSANGLTVRSTTPGNPPLTLYSRAGTPPMTVNRAAWVQNLNADLVDGRQAHELVRGGYCAENDAADADYSCTMNVTAPRAGWLFMSASVDLWRSDPGGDLMHCRFTLDGTEVVGSYRAMDIQNPGNQESDCATDAAVEVAAGAHSVVFEMNSVNSPTKIEDVGAYVFFVPFDGSGSTP